MGSGCPKCGCTGNRNCSLNNVFTEIARRVRRRSRSLESVRVLTIFPRSGEQSLSQIGYGQFLSVGGGGVATTSAFITTTAKADKSCPPVRKIVCLR